MDENVDIVITWVDGKDPIWLESRNKYRLDNYLPVNNVEDSTRFRSWDNLQYIFRGIENYMPWVNHVYLVTSGQCPEWIDLSNRRLTLVDHKDFIPSEYLPTFNSNTIDLNLFRIKGLSEKFIYFNDDMFVLNKTKKEDFYINGVPCDSACISPQPIHRDDIRNIEINNLKILNDHFSMQDIKTNSKKWFDVFRYKGLALRSILFSNFSTIIGIYEPHLPISHLKSNCEEIWEKEFEELNNTSLHHFRSTEDVNQWLFRNWMLLGGQFMPRNINYGTYINSNYVSDVCKLILHSSYKLVCINDGSTNEQFEDDKKQINNAFQKKFPQKSSFEKR